MAIEVEITHTMQDGTLLSISGGRIPREVIDPLRRQPYCWRWSQTYDAYRQQSSQDQKPRRGRIQATREYLEKAGYAVTVSEDTELRPMRQVEADRAASIDDRAARLSQRAETKTAQAEAHQAKADYVFANRPMGQPHLVDHHSFNKTMREHECALANDEKARDLRGYGQTLNTRAETAAHHNDNRASPGSVRARVRRLEGELREVNTRLTKGAYLGPGHYEPYGPRSIASFEEDKARIEHELEYWRARMEEHVASGELTSFSKDDFPPVEGKRYCVRKGQRQDWYRVVRANKATVTVETVINADGVTWQTGTLPYDKISQVALLSEQPSR